jgi:hypothetical protein
MQKLPILHFLILLFVVVNIILIACKESTKSEEEIVLPESNLTYFRHMQKLFNVKCATPGCHTYLDQAGNLDLTDYAAIMTKTVEGELIVIPEYGEQSFLYRILIENYKGQLRMPLNGPYLNSNNTNGVKIWIDEGAKP